MGDIFSFQVNQDNSLQIPPPLQIPSPLDFRYFETERAISNQICDVRTKFDILYAFVNFSLCLTHRKHSIQRALDSPGSGERFKYVERARKVYRMFFRDI